MAKKKLTVNEKINNLIDTLAGEVNVCAYLNKVAKMPMKLKIARLSYESTPIILLISKDYTVRLCSEEFVTYELFRWIGHLPKSAGPYMDINKSQCKTIVETWMYTHCDMTKLPKPVAFKSDQNLAFTRLNFDPDPKIDIMDIEEKAPIFAKMLTRISNWEALCMRIGSIFDEKADRKQAIWMSGPKDCGKSAISWLLQEISGGNYAILSNAELETNYWKALLVGKRIALVNESAPRFIRRDDFKSITGDLEHSINQKNVKIYVTSLPVLLFFASNNPPEVQSDEAIIERIIDCRFESIPHDEIMSETRLKTEMIKEIPAIVGFCIGLYNSIAVGSRIPCDKEDLRDTIDSFESEYVDFLDRYFIYEKDARILRSEFKDFIEIHGFRDSRKQSILKKIMLRRWKIDEIKTFFRSSSSDNKKRIWVYKHLRFQTIEEMKIIVLPIKSVD